MNRSRGEVGHDRCVNDKEIVERLEPQICIDDGIRILAHPAGTAGMMVRDDRSRDEVVHFCRTVQRAPQEFALSPAGEFLSVPDGPRCLECSAKPLAVAAKAMRAGVIAMGLSIWAASDGIASLTTTAVRTPEGVDEKALRQAARGRYGVVFSSGCGETLGKLTRIGHMGPTAQPIYAVAALTALGGALNAAGQKLAIGRGIEAALAVIDADA